MKLKRYLWLAVLLIAIALSALPVYSQQVLQPHLGFQVSISGALNAGLYEAVATFVQLKQHGDIGLGTVEGLDGEMVALDRKFDRIKADGVAHPIAEDTKTLSAVTFFHKEQETLRNWQIMLPDNTAFKQASLE